MSEQPLGGMNAWGGRRADGGSPVAAVPDGKAPEQRRVTLDAGALRDVASMTAVLTSGPLVTAGAGVAWGVGPALLALGLWLLLIGVGLGIGSDR